MYVPISQLSLGQLLLIFIFRFRLCNNLSSINKVFVYSRNNAPHVHKERAEPFLLRNAYPTSILAVLFYLVHIRCDLRISGLSSPRRRNTFPPRLLHATYDSLLAKTILLTNRVPPPLPHPGADSALLHIHSSLLHY